MELAWCMKKQGYRESTISVTPQRLKHLIKIGANLIHPESINEAIAQQEWQESTKVIYVNAYARFAEMQNLRFDKPRYKADHQKIPFIPTETELDQLIASCSKKVSMFLQLLKETGMRSGEAFRLKWRDFDFVKKTVRVNNPEKHGNTRILKISDKLIAMLKSIPQKSESLQRVSSLNESKLRNPEKENRKQTQEPKVTENFLPHIQTLESHNDLP